MRGRIAFVVSIAAAAFTSLCGMTGCAIPIGLAATAGLSAVQAGGSAWVNGELRESVFLDLETVHAAAHRALDDLQVHVFTDRLSERSAHIMAKEPGGPEIRITMVRRTPQVTRIGVRIGILGELSTSQVVMERLLIRLPDAHAPSDSQTDGSQQPH